MTVETERRLQMVNVLTLKWGTLYSAEYVNRLYRGVKRNLHQPFRFVCATDDATGLDPEIDAQPLPERPPELRKFYTYGESWPMIYVKLCVFRKGFADLSGPTLFLDIDQLILGDMDRFFSYRPGEFCIIRNWVQWRKTIFRKPPFCGNSSCFRFEAGEKSDYVYRKFVEEIDFALDKQRFTTEQAYLTHAVGFENVRFWPDDFVASFKRTCTWPWPLNHFLVPKLRTKASILCFHGRPNPHQAIDGYRGKHLNLWTRPCPWVKEMWER